MSKIDRNTKRKNKEGRIKKGWNDQRERESKRNQQIEMKEREREGERKGRR